MGGVSQRERGGVKKTGTKPPQRANIARRGPRQGTREQGTEGTRRQGTRERGSEGAKEQVSESASQRVGALSHPFAQKLGERMGHGQDGSKESETSETSLLREGDDFGADRGGALDGRHVA